MLVYHKGRRVLFVSILGTQAYSKWCPLKEGSMNEAETYLWRVAYQSAVVETDASLLSERIFEALVAIARRLRTPILIDGPEHAAIKAARRGLEALQTERIELQSDIAAPLIWHDANRN
jgi:hypothetical protein